jgi:hypothetical protein
VGFPDLTFLRLLFGHRGLAELEHAFTDCRAWKQESRPLVQALFSRRPSYIWPVV